MTDVAPIPSRLAQLDMITLDHGGHRTFDAWVAARDAATAAAWVAARVAAGDAAWDAARAAAWDAARAAAMDQLASTVETLQASALDLLDRMIDPAAAVK